MTDHTDLIAQLRAKGASLFGDYEGEWDCEAHLMTQAATALEALSQREARLVELLDCAVDEHDARFGRYRDRPQHWSSLARAALAEGGEK